MAITGELLILLFLCLILMGIGTFMIVFWVTVWVTIQKNSKEAYSNPSKITNDGNN